LTILKIEVGAYTLRIPQSFFPLSKEDYLYSFRASITSESPITFVSAPDSAEVTRDEVKTNHAIIERNGASGSSLVKDLVIYYRTSMMEHPVLLA